MGGVTRNAVIGKAHRIGLAGTAPRSNRGQRRGNSTLRLPRPKRVYPDPVPLTPVTTFQESLELFARALGVRLPKAAAA